MRNKSRQSNRKRKVILVLGVLLGIGFILYPFLSQLYYDQTAVSSVGSIFISVLIIGTTLGVTLKVLKKREAKGNEI